MNNNEVLKARNDYCIGRPCDDCIFNTYAKNKFNTDCSGLTTVQIYEILQLIKEEKSMTKKEEIQQEIEKTQKQLAALQEKLKEAENEVPEELIIGVGDEYYYVSYAGDIHHTDYTPVSSSDVRCARNHRAFLSEEYAKEFAEKTQFIADMLHFKYLYDRDYKPNWDSEDEGKYCIYYDIFNKQFTSYCSAAFVRTESVYFSTRQLAERCTKWLNKKYNYTKE